MLSKNELKKRPWLITCLDVDNQALSSLCFLAGRFGNLYCPFEHKRNFDNPPFSTACHDNQFNCSAYDKKDMERLIRAAFELGYIEQAMACQRILDGIPD